MRAERADLWSQVRGAIAAVARSPDLRRKLVRKVEIGSAPFVAYAVLNEGTRTFLRLWGIAVWDAITSLVPLLRVDGPATAWSLFLALAKIGLAAVPSVLWIRSSPRHRLIWLVPLVGILVIISSPLSLAACAKVDRWLLLAVMSATAVALGRVRSLRWTALLPFAVLWEVVTSHGLSAVARVQIRTVADRARLLAQCALNDGTRPQNVTADLLMPFHGITPLSDDLVLLTGEGPNDGEMRGRSGGRRVGSWWMRRGDSGFQFELPSAATGNLWRGCVLDETIWTARANVLVAAKRLLEGGPKPEEVSWVHLPSNDMDFGATACDPESGRIFATEAIDGGIWEARPDGREARRHQIGGVWMFPKRRFDGKLVVLGTAKLSVFAPTESRVIERVTAGFGIGGFDICESDGAVAVADMWGRVRVFQLDPAGHYRFSWGMSLFAPRRVAYSRDCSRIAVTSADDHSVFVIDAAARRVLDVLAVGPMLREVTPTGPREFSIADVCSMTTYRW